MYKYHPEIAGLKVNEDGTSVVYCAEELPIKVYKKPNGKTPQRVVNFLSRTHNVGRLVAECWLGLAPVRSMHAHLKDKSKGLHHTNLYWGRHGGDHIKMKRSKLSKIRPEDYPEIERRILSGHTLKSIAKDFGTSDMSIQRFKKRLKIQ